MGTQSPEVRQEWFRRAYERAFRIGLRKGLLDGIPLCLDLKFGPEDAALLPAVEQMSPPNSGPSRFGLWGGIAWFLFPHFDVRGDVIRRTTPNAPATNTFLLQLNGYL